MAIALENYPQAAIIDTGETSRYTAVWNRITYAFRRRDFFIISIIPEETSPSGIRVFVSNSNIASQFNVGSYVYLFSIYYEGAYQILSVDWNGSTTSILLDGTGTETVIASGFEFINLVTDRTSYQLQIEVYNYLGSTAVALDIATLSYRPDSRGYIYADIQAALRTLVSSDNNSTYDVEDSDSGKAFPFNIRYREYWKEGGAQAWSTIVYADRHFAVHAVKQNLQVYGENMGYYVAFPPKMTIQYNFTIIIKVTIGSSEGFTTVQEGAGVSDGFAQFTIATNGDAVISSDNGSTLTTIISNLALTTTMGDDYNELQLALANATMASGWSAEIDATGVGTFALKVTRTIPDTTFNSTTLVGDSVATADEVYSLDGGSVPSRQSIVLARPGYDDIILINNYDWTQDFDFDGIITGSDISVAESGDFFQNSLQARLTANIPGATIVLNDLEIADGGTMEADVSVVLPNAVQYGERTVQHGDIEFIDAIEIDNFEEVVTLMEDEPYHTGKFLTMFERPKFWPGFPFDLSFIMDYTFLYWQEFFSSVLIMRNEIRRNVNQAQVSEQDITIYDVYEHMKRTRLEGGYPSSVKSVDVKIDVGFETELLGYRRDVIDMITVDVAPVCEDPDNVYLCWLNPLGGYDYWLFDNKSLLSDSTSNERTYERFRNQNIEYNNSTIETIAKDIQPEIIVGYEGLTRQQAEGLRYLLRSTKVLRYIGPNPHNPLLLQWEVMRIKPGTFLILDTSETLSNIQFTLLPTKPFTQDNG